MDLQPTTTYLRQQRELLDARRVVERAIAAERAATARFSLTVAEHARAAGLGREAFVSHVHADAKYGNPSQELVTSRVVNAFEMNGEACLRIQLGKTNGQLGAGYAFLPVTAVVAVVKSFTAFQS